MVEPLFEHYGMDKVSSFANKVKVTNNFIGSQSGSYSPQSIEVNSIKIVPADYESWMGITFYLMSRAFGLGESEAKVIAGLCELSNTDREFSNINKVHEYIGLRIGICTLCVRNQVYNLRAKGFVKKRKGTIYVINERIWWMLKKDDRSRRLVINIDYETTNND